MSKKARSILSKPVTRYLLQGAKANLKRDQILHPAWIVQFVDGNTATYVSTEQLNEVTALEKRILMCNLAQHMDQMGEIAEAILILDVWYAEMDIDSEPLITMRPSQHPECKQAIMIAGRNAEKACTFVLLQPYGIDSHDQIIWGKVKSSSEITSGDRVEPVTSLLDYLFKSVDNH